MAAHQDGRLSMHGKHWRPRPVPEDADLANFRNNGISDGFDGYSWVGNNGKKVCKQEGVELAYKLIHSIVGEGFFNEYYPQGPGNPVKVEVDGREITSSDVTAVYNAWQLGRWFAPPAHIVEIGPGYGALTHILRRMYPLARFTLVDLPERHPVLEYYLGETIGLHDIEITTELPEDADVVVALRCLMEMPNEEIKRYFDWLQKESGASYFYLINRYFKYHALKSYPFDKHWIPLVNQTEIPFRKMHELLLQRVEDESLLLDMILETLPPYVVGDELIDMRGEYTVSKIRRL